MKSSSRWIWGTAIALLLGMIFGSCFRTRSQQAGESANSFNVAVASNFMVPARDLADRFEQATGIKPVLSFGSTGKHYTQIVNGAPFDIFFAADEQHPQMLEAENFSIPGERRTYAIGRLVLWSNSGELDENGGDALKSGDYNKLAIANPLHAPYGQAARETLEALEVWDSVQAKLVMGENIGQTHTFIATGNADIGFVALSQIIKPGGATEGSYWLVPQDLYSEINQQVILLQDKPPARQFMDYIRSEESRAVIESYGYGLP